MSLTKLITEHINTTLPNPQKLKLTRKSSRISSPEK